MEFPENRWLQPLRPVYFLRVLGDDSLLIEGGQAIYLSIYEYEHEHTGWLPGYYSIARYHRDMDVEIR